MWGIKTTPIQCTEFNSGAYFQFGPFLEPWGPFWGPKTKNIQCFGKVSMWGIKSTHIQYSELISGVYFQSGLFLEPLGSFLGTQNQKYSKFWKSIHVGPEMLKIENKPQY